MTTKNSRHSRSQDELDQTTETAEKTIPFLRRLVDMLSENQHVISFCPGSIVEGDITLGRIVVHDRVKVENDILPRYFNHSSFASLRRQLNYFSFTRIGKGRQKGATYCNEGVIVIEDILRLRRRSTSTSSVELGHSRIDAPQNRRVETSKPHGSKLTTLSEKVSPTKALCQTKKNRRSTSSFYSDASWNDEHQRKKPRHRHLYQNEGNERTLHIIAPDATPKVVSPVTSPVHTPSVSPHGIPHVTLDLTVPPPQMPSMLKSFASDTNVVSSTPIAYTDADNSRNYAEDPDVLAGCRALLCFSHGLGP